MRSRVGALVGPVAQRMWVSTFHSACVRILRRDAPRLGYKSSFTIYDQADAVRLVGYVLRDLNIDTKKFPPRTVHAIISAAKNELIDFETYAATGPDRPRAPDRRGLPRVPAAAAGGQRHGLRRPAAGHRQPVPGLPRRAGPLPAPLPPRPGRRVPGHQPGPERAGRSCSAGEHRNVCVVGDSDQSVYRFRGADIRNILQFEEAFPDATVIVLEQNYRSTQTILDAANAVIANNAMRKPKALWTEQVGGELITRYHAEDEHDEGSWVAGRDDPAARRRRARRPPLRLGRHRRLLPDQRPEPGGRGGAGPAQHPLQGGGRHQVLRPPGGQGPPRLPAGRRQPGRRGVAQADRQRAQAGRRRHQHRPARRLGPGPGHPVRRRPGPSRRGRRHRQGAGGHRATCSTLLDELRAIARRPSTAAAERDRRAARSRGVDDDGASYGPAAVLEAVLARTGYRAELEAEHTRRGRRPAGEHGRAGRARPGRSTTSTPSSSR